MKYVHTNIVTKNWKRLSQFYIDVFECIPVPPIRNQSGAWLENGTGVVGAQIKGIHLRLPGYGEFGPTLEIYQYSNVKDSQPSVANRRGIGHLAFEVDDIESLIATVKENGGKEAGSLSKTVVEGVGELAFVYLADPDGNIIEIQNWSA